MESLHRSEIDSICQVQKSLSNNEQLMLLMSRAGDPRNAFLIYFPVVYGLNQLQGRRLMLAAVVSEWLNIVFKWILFAHRPYWWVHEYKHDAAGSMKQFPLTCETGPGSPSGHAMVTAAVYYIIADASTSILPKFIPGLIFLIVMIPINLARVFIAAHFPHQVVAGTICGILIATALDKKVKLDQWRLREYFVTSAWLLFGCIGFSVSLGYLGVDLHWSVPLALKWCKNADWVHLDTTPFNSVTRDASILAGFGFSDYLCKRLRLTKTNTAMSKALHCLLSLILVNVFEIYKFEHSSIMSFYIYSAVKHFLIPFSVVFAVPFMLSFFVKHSTQKSE